MAAVYLLLSVGGQINAGCTNEMINSFGPCLSFVSGSGSSSVSPTAGCCDSLKSLMGSSMDCACLVVSGNIPLPIPINRTLAVSLPKACKSLGVVPIQCPRNSLILLQFMVDHVNSNISPPAPGPVTKSAGSPPQPIATPPAAPPLDAPSTPTDDNTGLNRPLFTPLSAATKSSYITALPIIPIVLAGFLSI
ncbi:non-specific lipid transfer protein GPI-anchored 16-like [Impatiens glandulifera]|uniref:non-specific lipid transfer protein GPI-anchored 16-like n=1 Tax=Impatiens glandulifera TaxID=253017 RepID=UPI001FB12B87|nr:non-specific lipid transfer protein GPI-anchored 16-like [Impatiens glandulifera]